MKTNFTARRAAGVIFAVTLIFGSGASLAAAPATGDPAKSDSENPEEFSRVRGLFDVDLPKTVPKNRIKFLLHPYFGDFLRRDYVRVPFGLRLGLTNHTEISAELESYLAHGLKKPGAGYGLYAFHLGAKYEWLKWLKPAVDASTGFNTTFPLSRPPVELTDGHNHFSPYVVFSKIWPTNPKFAPFLSLGTDLMWKSSVPGSFAKNQPHSASISAAPGFFYDLHTLKYTLVCAYTTTALIGREPTHFLSVNPSILWQLPPALTFHSKGRWIFGFGLKANFGPDGADLGAGAKLRGEFSLSRLFRPSPREPEKK